MNDATSKKWAIFAKQLSRGFIRNCTPKGYNGRFKHNIPRRLHAVADSPTATHNAAARKKRAVCNIRPNGCQKTAYRAAVCRLSHAGRRHIATPRPRTLAAPGAGRRAALRAHGVGKSRTPMQK